MKIRDRIKSLRRVRAGDLIPNPHNWRTHPQEQQDAIRGVLSEIGYADALLVREVPGGLQLIDGHLRADTTPDQKVPVLVLDLDDAEADKLLTLLDPLGAMAEANKDALETLLAECQTESEAVQMMLDGLAHMTTDEIVENAPELPKSVEQNIKEIEEIKSQRREGNANIAEKNDTEKYLVIVFSSRKEKENTIARLGLPVDERYIPSSAVDIRAKGKSIPIIFSDGKQRKAASSKHSGAGG
jgi:hypothetical protein